MFSMNPWHWVMAAAILAIFSFLYRENAVYRLAEHIFVGAAAGHTLGMAIGNIHRFGWLRITRDGQWHFVLPLILGVMLYARFVKGYGWVSRWPIAYLVGNGVGLSLYTALYSQGLMQLRASMIDFIVHDREGNFLLNRSFDNVILVFGVLVVLTYFIFSIKQSAPLKGVAHAGRWLMMVTFGVSFGNVVAGRISLALGRLADLYGTWLNLM